MLDRISHPVLLPYRYGGKVNELIDITRQYYNQSLDS